MDDKNMTDNRYDEYPETANETEHRAFIKNAKKFLCIALGIFSVIGMIFGYFYRNSKYLECFLGFRDGTMNIFYPIVYSVINSAAFFCIGVFAFTAVGTFGRHEKLRLAKAAYKTSKTGYTDIYKEKKSIAAIAKAEASVKAGKVIMTLFAVLAIILFLGLYAVSSVSWTVLDLLKDPVDRTNSIPRILIDVIGQGLFTIAVITGLVIIPPIITGSKKFNRIFLIALFAASVLAALHYAFFFFGNITAHASLMDLSAMMTAVIFCGFIGVYIADEQRMKVLKSFRKH